MADGTATAPPEAACDECEKVRIDKELTAAEAARAHERDLAKLALAHERELSKLGQQHIHALHSAGDAADIASQKLFHETIAEIAKGSIERSRDSAKYVQTAAAAIATLYTGVLALVFSVTDHPLPARGVLAPVFLGLSVALATAYLAYMKKAGITSEVPQGPSAAELAMNRSRILTRHVNLTIYNRKWAIRAAVISLGVGVGFIAAPFVGSQRATAIPAAPVAPAIPSQVADELSAQAVQLFEQQTASYLEAVNARNEAIKSAAEDAADAAGQDRTANLISFVLAALALVGVLGGPYLGTDDDEATAA